MREYTDQEIRSELYSMWQEIGGQKRRGNGHDPGFKFDSPPQIRITPFDQIKLNEDHRPYLVKGLIPRAGLAVVWGPPKSGKSFKVFDLCMHIALGWEYRGRRVQQGSVVYCSFEGQAGAGASSKGALRSSRTINSKNFRERARKKAVYGQNLRRTI